MDELELIQSSRGLFSWLDILDAMWLLDAEGGEIQEYV